MSGLGWRSPKVTGRNPEDSSGKNRDVYVCLCERKGVDVGGGGVGVMSGR